MKFPFTQFFKSIRKSKEETKVDPYTWFPIWENADLLSQIRFSIYKTNPKLLRSGVQMNLPFVKYHSEVEENVENIPLSSVNDLMKRFQTTNLQTVLEEVKTHEFEPRIIKIENPIALYGDALEKYEIQIVGFERYHTSTASSLREKLESLKKRELTEEEEFKILQELHAEVYDTFNSLSPEQKTQIIFDSGQARTPSKKTFMGQEYCVLMSYFGTPVFNEEKSTMSGGNVLPIFIPEDGYRVLPFGDMFHGRILGVLYYNPQPILRNLGPGFVLVVATIAVPARQDILNK